MTDRARRQELWALVGDVPSEAGVPSARRLAEWDEPSYHVEHLLLDLNGIEAVPAFFTRPRAASGTVPVVLYQHASGPYEIGKNELLHGRPALVGPPYAEALAAIGIGALAIDHWGWGERRGRTESALAKEFLWKGSTLWGMMCFDSLRALDYLSAREDVDAARIGVLGLSMGATLAWWTGALDERVAVVVDLCCLTEFAALIEAGGLDGHGLYYYVPGLIKHFTTAEINALIAPRPHLSLNGRFDPLTPPAGLARVDEALVSRYRSLGAEGKWRLVVSPTGHFETGAMRVEVIEWLQRWL